MIKKTKTIAITAYKRPYYFERLLLSLIQNDLEDWEIYIQLEFSEKVPYFIEITERLLKPYNYFLAVNTSVLGITNNPYHMLDKIFIAGSVCCIYLEEDLIVSPDITKLAAWYLKQNHTHLIALNLLMGSCMSTGLISHTTEPQALVKTRMINSLGLIFTEAQWKKHIKPNWYSTLKYPINWDGIPFQGWDLALFDYLLSDATLNVLQPIYARVTHMGELESTHTTPAFQKQTFSGLEKFEDSHRIDYHIRDIDYFPHPIRSHINLSHELTQALILLKKLKKDRHDAEKQVTMVENQFTAQITELRHTVTQLEQHLKQSNVIIQELLHSHSWRFTYPLRWLGFKLKRSINRRLVAE